MPAKVKVTSVLPSLSPISGKLIIACLDGGQLSSNSVVLPLHETETRLNGADQLAACVADLQVPGRAVYNQAVILRFPMLLIAADSEDGNDADSLRHEPAFKLALGRLPDGGALCSQATEVGR